MADFDLNKARGSLCDGLAKHFGDPAFSDLEVRVDGSTFRCHRVILSAQSDWFQKALTNGFKESKQDYLELEEDNVHAVQALLEFCYRLDYSCSAVEGSEAAALFHIEVFAIAEKYLVRSLQLLSTAKLADGVEEWEPGYLPSVTAIRLAYTITSDPDDILRPELVQHILNKPDIFRDRVKYASFHAVLESTPAFAADISRGLVAEMNSVVEHTYRCPFGCRNKFKAMIGREEMYTWHCHLCGKEEAKAGLMWRGYIVR